MAAHIVNAFVTDALRVPAILPPPLPVEGPALQQTVPPQQLAAELMARGLFALPPESSQAQGIFTRRGIGAAARRGQEDVAARYGVRQRR